MAKEKIFVCTKGKACRKRGSREVFCAMDDMIEGLGLEKSIKLKKSDCLGYCGQGPVIKVKRDKIFYGKVALSDVRELVWSLVSGRSIDRLLFKSKKKAS